MSRPVPMGDVSTIGAGQTECDRFARTSEPPRSQFQLISQGGHLLEAHLGVGPIGGILVGNDEPARHALDGHVRRHGMIAHEPPQSAYSSAAVSAR